MYPVLVMGCLIQSVTGICTSRDQYSQVNTGRADTMIVLPAFTVSSLNLAQCNTLERNVGQAHFLSRCSFRSARSFGSLRTIRDQLIIFERRGISLRYLSVE